MNLFDAALIFASGAGSLYAVQHFWPKGGVQLPTAAKVETTLSGFGQVLSHGEQSLLSFLSSMEKRIMSAVDDALARVEAKHAADKAAAVASAVAAATAGVPAQIDAAKAEQEAADAAKVNAVADAIPDPAQL